MCNERRLLWGQIEDLRTEAPKIRPRAFALKVCLAQWLWRPLRYVFRVTAVTYEISTPLPANPKLKLLLAHPF